MRSLFWKIFFWFWLSMGAVSVSAILVVVATQNEPLSPAWRETLVSLLTVIGREATGRIERQGKDAADRQMRLDLAEMRLQAAIYDTEARLILGASFPDEPMRLVRQAISMDQPAFELSSGRLRVARAFRDDKGARFVILADVPRGRPGGFAPTIEIRLLRVLAMILTAGVVCLALTRYLVNPISRLREATRRLAAGDLSVRTQETVGRRHDELGALSADFDRMAEQIERLIGNQRRLLGDISHELRSPLSRLQVALELARRSGHEATGPLLDQIEREADRINELIADLMALARLEGEKQQEDRRAVDLAGVIGRIISDSRFEAEAQNRGLEFKIVEDARYTLDGNAELLRRAIENVIRNALRFTPPGSTVQISLRREDASPGAVAVLTIRDHGPGVPAAQLDRIFEPFFRVAADRDRQTGGIGLGLAITRAAIEAHDGSVRAENVPPQGLLVTIRLPIPKVQQVLPSTQHFSV